MKKIRFNTHTFEYLLQLKQKLVDSHAECNGTGWIVSGKEETPCNCMKVFLYVEKLVLAGIPREYWRLSLEDLSISQEDKEFVRFYIDHFYEDRTGGFGILFFGSNGVGKTSLMCEIGKEALVSGYSVSYFTAQSYLDMKRLNLPELQEIEDSDFLLVDEFDKVHIAKGSLYSVKMIEEFLRKVSISNNCLILCSNSDLDGIQNLYGDSIFSVLQRHVKPYPIDGTDYSTTLNEDWHNRIVRYRTSSYLSEPFISMGEKLFNNEMETYNNEWKKFI